jgi:predicted RNA methylase
MTNTGLPDYSYQWIIGICQEFKRFHGRWPNGISDTAQFQAAGINHTNGAILNRMLKYPGPTLEADPGYRAACSLPCKLTNFPMDVSGLDPDFLFHMNEGSIKRMMESAEVQLLKMHDFAGPNQTASMFVWTARSVDDPMLIDKLKQLGLRVNVRFVPSDEVLDFIGRRGLIYGNGRASACDNYYFEFTQNDQIRIKYQKIIGGYFVADFTPAAKQALQDRINDQVRIALDQLKVPASRQGALVVGAKTLLQELATLVPKNGRLALPKQHLAHYDDIKALLEKAGGSYVTNKKEFKFEAGIDCEAVQRQLLAGETINYQQEYQFFATPEAQAIDICMQAGPLNGKRVLEPSAGDGAIAKVARGMGAKEVVTIEAWNVNAIKLRAAGFDPIERDFLSVTPAELGLFDAIVANPPFTKNQDIDHVMHMFKFLKSGGSLSVIMSTGWQSSTQRKHAEFKTFLATQNVSATQIDAGTFSESGTIVPTLRMDFSNYQDPALRDTYCVDYEETEEETEISAMSH